MSRCEKCGESFLCAEHKQAQCGLTCPPDWTGHWRDWHFLDHNCPTKGRLASERESAIAAWEAHKKAYEIVRAEMDDLHKTLTQCGVPEQIPPFKAALAPAKARVLYLSARCNQLFDETTDAQERLDQFEAYAITVKSALDDRNRLAELVEHDESFSTVVARLATALADRDALRRELDEVKRGK
jgi:hypothetical protein